MTHGKPRPGEFEELLSTVLDSEPTPENLERLQQIVRDDPAARKTYLARLELHAMLAWQLHWSGADDVLDVPGNEPAPTKSPGRECGTAASAVEECSKATGGTAASAVEQPRGRRLIYAAGGLLAAAASVVLLVTTWPTQSFDADVAAFGSAAYNLSGSPVRGEGGDKGESPTGPDDQPDWLLAALSDPAVEEALADQMEKGYYIGVELTRGRLRLDDKFRPAPAKGIEVPETRRKGLIKLIEDDRTACEKIVDALIRHHPRATERDRAHLTQTLNRWRAKHVFGPQEPDG